MKFMECNTRLEEAASPWESTGCVEDCQRNISETAALIAYTKIEEEKARILTKSEAMRKQFQRERRKCIAQIEQVRTTAKASIAKLIDNKQQEIQDLIQKLAREHQKQARKVRKEGRKKNRRELLEPKSTIKDDGMKATARNVLKEKSCVCCGNSGSGLWLCGGCLSTWYCNKGCQGKDWKKHQEVCHENQREDTAVMVCVCQSSTSCCC